MKRILILCGVCCFFFTFSACSKVNQENYDKLKIGMDYKEVVDIIGKPDECKSILNAKNCTWGKTPKTISVKFMADKVILTSSEGL